MASDGTGDRPGTDDDREPGRWGHTIRRAQRADIPGILGIGVMYGGLDPLPARIDRILTDPDTLCHVADIEGQIVAFCAYHVIDNGSTAVGQYARMREDFRKSGLTQSMRDYATMDIMRSRPRLRSLICTSVFHEYWKIQTNNNKTYFKIIGIRKQLKVAWNIDPGILKSALPNEVLQQGGNVNAISRFETLPMDMKRVADILLDKNTTQMLFPNNTMSMDLEFFKPMEANLRVLEYYGCNLYGSVDSHDKAVALSLSNPYHIQNGINCFIHYHGLVNNDIVIEHVRRHCLETLNRYRKGRLYISVFLDPTFCKHSMGEVLKRNFKVTGSGDTLRDQIMLRASRESVDRYMSKL